jgi:hypothetical protein
MALKLKRDKDGNVVTIGEKPVIINDADGTETTFDIEGTISAVKERNAEIVRHRTDADKLREQLNAFTGIDPVSAKDALDKLSKIDQKKLIDAGQVDQVVGTLKSAHAEELARERASRDGILRRFKDVQLSSAFANSQFLATKTRKDLHPLVRSYFEKRFLVEDDGNVQALDESGKLPLLSVSNPGKNASFDEALEQLIGQSPFRDALMVSPQGSGSNTPASSGSASGGRGRMSRAQLESLPAHAQFEAATNNEITD